MVAASQTFVTALTVAVLCMACVSSPSSPMPRSPDASVAPASSAVTPSQPPAPTPTFRETTRPTSQPSSTGPTTLPVRGGAASIASGVVLAPGPDGSLFISVPAPSGSVLAMLDQTGTARSGWPVEIGDSTSCGAVLPAPDGSVRFLCTQANPDGPPFSTIWAFAFDSAGQVVPGWPRNLLLDGLHGYGTAQVIGSDLLILGWAERLEGVPSGEPTITNWVVSIAPDGTIRTGSPAPGSLDDPNDSWAFAPDRVAYGTTTQYGESAESPKTSQLRAVGMSGAQPGFPVSMDGIASPPAFDAIGRIHVTVRLGRDGPSRAIVFDANGRVAPGASGALSLRASANCYAIEGSCEVPIAPLVGPGGTRFVWAGSTVAGIGPAGRMLAGWPFRSSTPVQTGGEDPGASDPGGWLAVPSIGPGNILYLIVGADSPSAGGAIVAVGPDARVRPGWPLQLQRPGAFFRQVTVGPDGTAYALAIEPEAGGSSSATILAIAPDRTILWKTTIIDR